MYSSLIEDAAARDHSTLMLAQAAAERQAHEARAGRSRRHHTRRTRRAWVFGHPVLAFHSWLAAGHL